MGRKTGSPLSVTGGESCANNCSCYCQPEEGVNKNAGHVTQQLPQKRRMISSPSSLLGGDPSTIQYDSDTVLAREMAALTVQQRNLIYEEIHAVADIPNEESDFVDQCLVEMEQEIVRLRDKASYNKALFLEPNKVKDRAFRLMFLRAESFDPRESAKRIIKHFEYKAKLFGEDLVAKTITLDDLNEDDMICLMSGGFQILPGTDNGGRGIMFQYRKHVVLKTWQSEMRARWYQMMCVLEKDENIQKRGVVQVGYALDVDNQADKSKGKPRFDFLKNSHILGVGVPCRVVAIHHCSDSILLKASVSMFLAIIGTNKRLRFRAHFGSHMEVQYKLESFGITREIIPLDDDNELKRDSFHRFLEHRKIVEDKTAEEEEEKRISNGVGPPTTRDVLLGRGFHSQNHTGNLELKRIIEQSQEKYRLADRFGKTCISWDIIKTIQNDKKGRFLEQDEVTGEWQVAHDDVARDKVSHGFRVKKKQKKRPRDGE